MINQDEIEFILVDFGSSDCLLEWIKVNFLSEINSGYLKYFFTDELPNWHMSIAKNTAHKLAKGEILTNLDCDNYTGKNGGLFIIKQFQKYGPDILLHQSSGIFEDGTSGRISLLRKYYNLIGGYDESFYPMGHEDNDLINRIVEIGLTYINKSNKCYSKAIKNSKAESIKYSSSDKTYMEMVIANMSLGQKNIRLGKLIAN